MTTIVCIGDARPTSSEHGSNGWTKLTPDLNQIIPQSPTGQIDSIFLIGDFDHVKDTEKAFAASDVSNKPHYYVVGNHEIDQGDMPFVRGLFPYSKYGIPLNPGSLGTNSTTYSMDVGDIHIININTHWDGKSNDAKSSAFIPDALYNWVSNDLSNTNKKWKIVLVHEPMYPFKRHVGESLDGNKSNRDKFQKLLVAKKVAIVYAAHTHYSHVVDPAKYGGIYHIDTGVSGPKIKDGEDDFTSLFYTHTSGDDLVITWKKSPWNSPKTTTYTIKGDGTTTKKYKCVNNTCTEDTTGTFDDSSCGGTCTASPTLSEIKLTGCSKQPKQIEDECTITATCKDSVGSTITCPNLTWTSSDSSIVSVNQSGRCTAITEGSASVHASSGNIVSNSVNFTVGSGTVTEGGNSGIVVLALAAAGYYLYTRSKKL